MKNFKNLDYHAIDVAKHIIKKYNDNHVYISNLILQKMLFFVQRNSLQNYQTNIFTETFQAWKFGPVISEVYYNFCHAGALPLKLTQKEIEEIKPIDDIVTQIIYEEFEKWKDKIAYYLINETHKKGGAWEYVIYKGLGLKGTISNDLIYRLG